MSGQDRLIGRIARIVGDGGLLADADAMAPYLVDWRGAFRGRARAVVRPADTDAVAGVVALCREAGVAVVPQGGNTGLVGGATPHESGGEIVVSLERMNRVRGLDTADFTMTVEAGCILADVQAAAAAAGRFFPLSLGAEGTCRIGGNIATNAGGNATLRFGNARELVLGLEVVLPDGRVWNGLSGLRKNNTGYDLKQLHIGGEGTLGIITAATLRLFPRRRQVETALVAFDSLDKAVALFSAARERLDEFLSAFELIPRIGLDMALEHVPQTQDPLAAAHPWYALVEVSSGQTAIGLADLLEGWLGEALEDGTVVDGVVARSQRMAAGLWHIREACVEAQRLAGPSVKHDVSVPVSRVAAFIAEAGAAVARRAPETRVVAFGHVGDGNIHFNVCSGPGQDRARFLEAAPALTALIYDIVARHRGSFSAEHGIGRLRREPLATYLPPVARDQMAAIKAALDPGSLMNPGTIFHGAGDGRAGSGRATTGEP